MRESLLSLTRLSHYQNVFDSVAAAQQIRGGAMNLNRTHKSTLVLLAYVLNTEKIIRENEREEIPSSLGNKVT